MPKKRIKEIDAEINEFKDKIKCLRESLERDMQRINLFHIPLIILGIALVLWCFIFASYYLLSNKLVFGHLFIGLMLLNFWMTCKNIKDYKKNKNGK